MKQHSKLLCLLFFLQAVTLTQAQNALVHGIIVDTLNQPLALVEVTIKTAIDSTFISGEVTDENGQFTIVNLEPGDYILKASYLSLASLSLDISLKTNEKLNIGTQMLTSSEGINLKGVTVSAKRPLIELKNDKMIFNVFKQFFDCL